MLFNSMMNKNVQKLLKEFIIIIFVYQKDNDLILSFNNTSFVPIKEPLFIYNTHKKTGGYLAVKKSVLNNSFKISDIQRKI